MPNQEDSGFSFKPSIPQLFYDIIARIVPGAVIIAVLAVAVAGPEKSARVAGQWLNKPGEDYPSIIAVVFFGFVLSYTLAIVFLGICHLISWAYRKWRPGPLDDDELSMKYDFIKKRDPAAGSRITKLTAERHMAGILTFGLVLALPVSFVGQGSTTSRLIFAVVVGVASAGSLGAYSYFVRRQDRAIKNYCRLLGYDEWKADLMARTRGARPEAVKFVVMFGPPAVGKMTVGDELAKLTGFKLFHNHMTIDLVLNFFDFGDARFHRLVSEFRRRVFEQVAASELPGLIFTYVWALDQESDRKFIEEACRIFRRNSAEVYFVELEAELSERLKRNESESRLLEKPSKRDIQTSRAKLLEQHANYKLNSNGDFFYAENYLKINNTHLSAPDAARKIVEVFSLNSKAAQPEPRQ